MLLFWPLVIPFATAVLCMLAWRSRPRAARPLARRRGRCSSPSRRVILARVARDGPFAEQAGGWAAPFGITLVADRLSAIMVFLDRRSSPSRVLVFGLADVTARGGALRPPPADPRHARRHLRRLPDRRHLQHVRLVRGDADRLLRPARRRRRPGRARRRDQVRRPQPDRHRRLPRRASACSTAPPVRSTWPTCTAGSPAAAMRDADHRLRRLPDLRLRLQGRALPGLLLAAGQLPHPVLHHLGALRRAADQGRGLRADPRLHPGLSGRRDARSRPCSSAAPSSAWSSAPLGALAMDRHPPRPRLLDHRRRSAT